MNKKHLTELYSSMQEQMIADLHSSRRAFDHSSTKGEATETNWIEWMRRYLPKRYCVDKAFVIDSDNNVSQQIDLVIYDQQYSHPVFIMGDNKYVTAESVYAVFEIKQTLNKAHMEYAGEKIKSVRELNRTTVSIVSANGQAVPKPLHRIVSGFLALDSDWVEPIQKNVVAKMLGCHDQEKVDLICCMEKGSFSATYNQRGKITNIVCSKKEESLVFFFLELLKKLQSIGTVPAIDIQKYENAITQDLVFKLP